MDGNTLWRMRHCVCRAGWNAAPGGGWQHLRADASLRVQGRAGGSTWGWVAAPAGRCVNVCACGGSLVMHDRLLGVVLWAWSKQQHCTGWHLVAPTWRLKHVEPATAGADTWGAGRVGRGSFNCTKYSLRARTRDPRTSVSHSGRGRRAAFTVDSEIEVGYSAWPGPPRRMIRSEESAQRHALTRPYSAPGQGRLEERKGTPGGVT